MQLNAKQSFFIVVSGYLLGFGSLTLLSNSWVAQGGGKLYKLYMCRNIGPAAAGPAAMALQWNDMSLLAWKLNIDFRILSDTVCNCQS